MKLVNFIQRLVKLGFEAEISSARTNGSNVALEGSKQILPELLWISPGLMEDGGMYHDVGISTLQTFAI